MHIFTFANTDFFAHSSHRYTTDILTPLEQDRRSTEFVYGMHLHN